MPEALELPLVQRALLAALLLSVAGGLLGTWIVLRGLAFFAHAVGTAAFPGLVLAGGLGFAAPLGALATALVFTGAVPAIRSGRRVGPDSATALILVACLAAGVILASDVFGSGAGIESLLFGSLLLTDELDILLAAGVALLALLATAAAGPRWLATGFDTEAARSLGVRARGFDVALLGLVAVAVVASLATIGALLTTALFVVPAATARLVTGRLVAWQAVSVALTAAEAVGGLWLSVALNAPPGATIAVVTAAVFAAVAIARRPRGPVRGVALLAALAVAVGLAGCGRSDGGADPGSRSRLEVMATTTQVADLVRAVGGPAVDVHGILAPNSDPHGYEPRPADVTAAARARLVFVSGQGLDPWAGEMVSRAGGSPRVVDLSAGVAAPAAAGSHRHDAEGAEAHDPHWWHDPANARTAVLRIRRELIRAAPGSRDLIETRVRAYLARIARLDAGIRRCMAAVPADQRKLVTDHDAFGHFARRYAIEVVGAIFPARTTQAQPSAGDLAGLAALIRRERVRAIFPESSLPPRLARAIARQTGASADHVLHGDSLGPPGSPADTYLAMEAANADAMVRGFTGGRRGCAIAGLR